MADVSNGRRKQRRKGRTGYCYAKGNERTAIRHNLIVMPAMPVKKNNRNGGWNCRCRLAATNFVCACAMAATFDLISSNCKLPTNNVAKCNQPVKKHVSEPTRVY